MRISSSILALCAALAVPATFAIAQQAGGGGQRGPSTEMIGRMQDGQLAGAKAMLRLTPEQDKLWSPVEAQIRASYEDRAKRRAEHEAKRAERQASGDQQGHGRIGLPERLDRATEMTTKRAEQLKAFAAAVKPLYASLSDEQKLVANRVLGHFVGGGKGGKEHGWGGRHGRMHGEHRGGWGGKHADGGWGGRHGGGRYGNHDGGMRHGVPDAGGPGDTAPEAAPGPGMGAPGTGR